MGSEELSRGIVFEAVLIGLYTNWLINMFWEAPFAEGNWLLSGGIWICFTFGIWNLVRYFQSTPRVGSHALIQIICLAIMSLLHHRIVGDVGLLNLMTKYYLGAMLLGLIVRFDPLRETPISIEFLLDRGANGENDEDDDDFNDYDDDDIDDDDEDNENEE